MLKKTRLLIAKFSMLKYIMMMRRYHIHNSFENIRDVDQLTRELNELLDKQPESISECVKDKRADFYSTLLDYQIDELWKKYTMTPAEVKKMKADLKKPKPKPGTAVGSVTSFEARRQRAPRSSDL